MKKMILLTSMLLALTVSAALAGGVNLNWGNYCYTDDPVAATVFACDVNTSIGNRVMTVSWMLDASMADLVAIEWLIEGQSDADVLPEWWQLGDAVTDCRSGKATFFSDRTLYEGACLDWSMGAAYNVGDYTWDTNKTHLALGYAVAADGQYLAVPGQEYFGGGVNILNSKTVGTPSCAGCSIGMIFGLHTLTVAALDGRRDDFFEALPGGNQCLSWNNTTTDCSTVPVRGTTWGQIKSLYR